MKYSDYLLQDIVNLLKQIEANQRAMMKDSVAIVADIEKQLRVHRTS